MQRGERPHSVPIVLCAETARATKKKERHLSSHATVVTRTCIPAPHGVNPPQIDAPAVEIRAATAVPIADLIDFAGDLPITTGANTTPAAAPLAAAVAPSTADIWAQDMFAVSDDDTAQPSPSKAGSGPSTALPIDGRTGLPIKTRRSRKKRR